MTKPEFKRCILTIREIEGTNPKAYMADHNGEMIGQFVIGLPATIDAWNLEITLAELEHAMSLHNSAQTTVEMHEANKLLPPILQRSHRRPQAYIRNYSASDMSITD